MTEHVIPKQTCWGCQHFLFEFEGNWSEMTPGNGLQIVCLDGHYALDNCSTEADFGAAMQQGFTCLEFTAKP